MASAGYTASFADRNYIGSGMLPNAAAAYELSFTLRPFKGWVRRTL